MSSLWKVIKDRPGMIITRLMPPDGAVIHEAKSDAGRAELGNELRFLRELATTPFVPQVLNHNVVGTDDALVDSITMEDVGESLGIVDEEKFRTHFLRFLWELKQRQIEHGDLTSANIRVKDDIPKVLDWKESRFSFEHDRPTKRPEGDVHHAFQFLASLKDGSRHGRRLAAMLKAVNLQQIVGRPWHNFPDGKRWVDVGCFHGDIPACAAVAGFENVAGIDSDRSAIIRCQARFNGFGIMFQTLDAIELRPRPWNNGVNVLSCLSAYPYILNKHGDIESNRLIEGWIDKSDMMFFECQLSGDGPGPEEFKTTRHIEEWLHERGADSVEAIVEIQLPDRNTTRTTFKVS